MSPAANRALSSVPTTQSGTRGLSYGQIFAGLRMPLSTSPMSNRHVENRAILARAASSFRVCTVLPATSVPTAASAPAQWTRTSRAPRETGWSALLATYSVLQYVAGRENIRQTMVQFRHREAEKQRRAPNNSLVNATPQVQWFRVAVQYRSLYATRTTYENGNTSWITTPFRYGAWRNL